MAQPFAAESPAAVHSSPAVPRLIKRYPNRRIYDTEVSRYITHDTLYRYVEQGISFVVRCFRTDEDLTRPVLLALLAADRHDEALPSCELLQELIRRKSSKRRSAVNAALLATLRRIQG